MDNCIQKLPNEKFSQILKCLNGSGKMFGKFCICYKNVTKNVSFSMSENLGQISPFVIFFWFGKLKENNKI